MLHDDVVAEIQASVENALTSRTTGSRFGTRLVKGIPASHVVASDRHLMIVSCMAPAGLAGATKR